PRAGRARRLNFAARVLPVGQVTASSAHGDNLENTIRGCVAGRQRRILVSGSLAMLLLAASSGARPQSDGLRQGHSGNGAGGIFLAQALPARDLSGLSLEQLGSIVVTSVSRRRERLSDVSSSIYVISAQDIHRAGATTLGEALRLAPNLNVAQADTAQYAISARGFNNVLANKMLVLI